MDSGEMGGNDADDMPAARQQRRCDHASKSGFPRDGSIGRELFVQLDVFDENRPAGFQRASAGRALVPGDFAERMQKRPREAVVSDDQELIAHAKLQVTELGAIEGSGVVENGAYGSFKRPLSQQASVHMIEHPI